MMIWRTKVWEGKKQKEKENKMHREEKLENNTKH